jgi:hypothetical protein
VEELDEEEATHRHRVRRERLRLSLALLLSSCFWIAGGCLKALYHPSVREIDRC